jgi:putative endonuclease
MDAKDTPWQDAVRLYGAGMVLNRQSIIAVYIMASKRNGTLYTGVTSALIHRVYQHRNALTEGFTKRYGCRTLVWYELHDMMATAIQREKNIKSYPRRWKINLIEAMNPDWQDLWLHISR